MKPARPICAWAAIMLAAGCQTPGQPDGATGPAPFLARTSQAWLDEQKRAGIEIVSLTALLRGTLQVRNGCFVAGPDANVLIVTDPTARVVRVGGRYGIRNDATGATVFVGDRFRASGGGGERLPDNLEKPVPPPCRFGRYFGTGAPRPD